MNIGNFPLIIPLTCKIVVQACCTSTGNTYALYFGTAQLLGIFKVICYSDKGSNNRQKEEETYSKFVDYLDDCENGKVVICVVC